MPSTFAYLALFLWPLVVIALFRKRPLDEALAWSIIGGYMLLPQVSAFDLPLLPAWNKDLVPSLFAAIMCFALVLADKQHRPPTASRANAAHPRRPANNQRQINPFDVKRGKVLFWALLILLFGSPFITGLSNTEPVIHGIRSVAGMRIYDSFSMNLDLLVGLAPFFLARRFLATPESHVVLLRVLVIACLGYSILALWELRMSPRLNRDVYGFFAHSWSQHIRYGGYRPILFLYHGIWVAILFSLGTIAAAALWRHYLADRKAGSWFLATLWLFGVTVLCKSVGAIVIAVVLLLLVLLCSTRVQMLTAAAIATAVLIYPTLRGADVIPTEQVLSFFSRIDPVRAGTLEYRFEGEDMLLERANEKPLAGWGSWGRNRVNNDWGGNATATDGYWVIVIGVYGWLGYIAQFSLLGGAIILLTMNRRRLNLSHASVGLCVVMAAALTDLIPNATISPVVWLIAGALMGRYQTATATAKQTDPAMSRAGTEMRPAKGHASKPRDSEPQDYPVHIRRPREG